jgi:hypothetical protein
MMNKLLSLAAGAALVALTGTAYAGQPSAAPAKQALQLSDNQMDRVTAGGVGIANGASLALGEVTAVTFTQTSTNVVTVNPGRIAIGQAFSQALASGGFLFQAAAISHADTAASLP